MSCRAIFFDVGGTLLRPWPSVGAVYARVGSRHGIVAEAEELDRKFRAAWASVRALEGGGRSSSKEWWRKVVDAAVPGATDDYFEELYATFARAEAWRVFDDVAETLREARRRGLYVGVISNWDERLRLLLGAVGLTDWDSITVSCEVGAEKPAAEIFLAALKAAQVPAGEAMHVGDSFAEDVAGAEAAGMRAVLIDREGRSRNECRTVRDLRELWGFTPSARVCA